MDFPLLIAIFPQVVLDGLILGFMYALIALGYTMVYGVLEFINFAHSEIFIFGAFVGVEILLGLKAFGVLGSLSPFLVLMLLLIAGMAASALLAVVVERVAYRPLRGAPRLVPLISAIGVSFFLQDAIRLVESVWNNAFNLVYPTMPQLNVRYNITEAIDVPMKSLVAIDTEAEWAKDGQSLFFTSDRAGNAQVYRVRLDEARKAERVTFTNSYNARPRLSPDGKELALVTLDRGGYRIGVMDLASRNLRVLTNGHQDESPSFAPNGALVIYATREGGRGSLAITSSDGAFQQRLSSDQGDVRDPAWQPFGPRG